MCHPVLMRKKRVQNGGSKFLLIICLNRWNEDLVELALSLIKVLILLEKCFQHSRVFQRKETVDIDRLHLEKVKENIKLTKNG